MSSRQHKNNKSPQGKSLLNTVLKTVDKTVLRTIGLSGVTTGGAEGAVDVKDGKIVRIRPLHYDWKYNRQDLNPWKFQRNGKTLEPNWKSLPGPYSLAYKKTSLFS